MSSQDPAPLKPIPETTSFWSRLNAVTRHAVTVGGTLLSIAGLVAILPKDKVQPAIAALQVVGDDLFKLFGDLYVLWGLVGPAAIAWAMRGADIASGLTGQLKSITSNREVHIDSPIYVPKDVADKVPSPLVVPYSREIPR